MIFISVSGSTPSEFGCSADMHVGRLRDGGGTTTRHDTQVRVIMELLLRAINVPVLLSDVSTRDDRLLSQQCSKLDCSSIGLSAGRPHCSYCTCRSHLVPTFKFGHVLRQKKDSLDLDSEPRLAVSSQRTHVGHVQRRPCAPRMHVVRF